MLSKLELEIHYNHTEQLTYHISSTMHGLLMDYVDYEYGELLHRDGRKPFHQYLSQMKRDSFVWTICTLNEEARIQIIDRLKEQDHFLLKHKNLNLYVTDRKLTEMSYDELIERYYFEPQSRNIRLRFLTPTSFKSQGRYVFFPDLKLIFQSLMLKYDAFSDTTAMASPEVLEHIENYSYIRNYNLRSIYFSLEGVKINAFLGEITIHVNGPEQMVNLMHLMTAYGEYAGVGIKSSLGMGAIHKIE